jgi:hypothetical protein
MLRAIIDGLRGARLPARLGDDDPIAAAWAASDDVQTMVQLLVVGADLGLYEVSGQSWTRERAGDGWAAHPRCVFRLRLPDKRYVRVDFTGGAAELRAIVPTVAPYETWARVIEEIRERITDPIALLVWDLERRGAPDPGWSARWTLDEAWRVSSSSISLRTLLGLGGRGDLQSKVNQAIAAGSPPHRPSLLELEGLEDEWSCDGSLWRDLERRMAAYDEELDRFHLAIVRQVVPELPSLALPPGC